MKKTVLYLLLCLSCSAYAQKKWPVQYHQQDTAGFKKKWLVNFVKDTVYPKREFAPMLKYFKEQGFSVASIDTFYFLNDTMHTYIYVGPRQSTLQLQNGNLSPTDISRFGLSNYLTKGKRMEVNQLPKTKESIIAELENSGYPFAECYLDSFENRNDSLSARIYLEKHSSFVFDSISLQTPSKVRRVFLRNYLGIKMGKPYKESTVKKVDNRLNMLVFAEPMRKSNVEFHGGKARVNVFLKDRKANQFDLLIGVLPGSSGQKVLITGQAQLHLVSPFGVGEEFRIKWEKLQPKTQTLDVQLIYPYTLGLPLGINAQFQLYKKDTAFLNLDGDYGVQYQLQGSDYIKASYRQHTTIILNVDTNYVKLNRTLPGSLDVSSNELALELFLQQLNYRFNPTSGYILKTSASFGLKTIKKNNAIAGLYDAQENKTFNSLYDTIRLKTFIMQLSFSIDKFWKVAKRQTIRTNLEGKYMFNPRITDNELYRIGGTSTLRGFDDRSIYTPYYLMLNAEYRYLLSKNAFFFLFVNTALVKEYRNFKNAPFDFPYGFGAGAAIETKIGMFALSYAMGARQDEKVTFKSAKIHVGYINYF